jgi:hypothetical protein
MQFATGVVDFNSKFATGINNRQNFPPVSLIPVVHLDL